ncbi:RNA polymerase II-associated [Jimgerdemannia flammicorona]|uniref:RNA polymerase II-associated n=2 Tax=Jimgerdemannia flammicorona TaxID=994334 RepID=A0A433DKJ2_9FUNG|nr:RNA polymerase II-associated [Jimgerdemannia flammicorona]RUS34204.1 RNA polymerase II-associated [Jimgerdemannia flammicorona]
MSIQPQKKKFGAEFLCRVRHRNILPPVPFGPKLITTPPLTARFIKYESTSLVEKTPYALAVDQDLGMPIDTATIQYLERLETGDEQGVPALSPEDRDLLVDARDETSRAGAGLMGSKRPMVTWLRRSEYISSEASKTVGGKDQSVESRFGTSGRGHKATQYPTVSKQTAGIARTFAQSASIASDLKQLKHPKRPHLQAVSSHAIFPDLSTWSHVYTLGQFSTDPAEDDNPRAASNSDEAYRYERHVLRPMTNPDNKRDNFLNLFLPELDSARRLKRRRIEQEEDDVVAGSSIGDSDKPFWYDAIRDYTYQNLNLPELQNVVMVFRDEGLGEKEEVFYNVAKIGSRHQDRDRDGERKSALTIQFRPRTEEEEEERRTKMREVGVDE